MSAIHSTLPIRPLSYGRVSEPEQRSVPEQLQWAREFASLRGWDPPEEFEDSGIAGDELVLRPGLHRLINRAKQRFEARDPSSVLLWWKPDRFSRANVLATAGVLDDLVKCGVRWLVTTEGETDLHDSKARLLLLLQQELQCAAFSPGLSLNVLRSMLERARSGYWMGGKAPYGYRIVNHKLVPGPEEEVEVVRWLFRAYADTITSARKLALELNRRGVKPPRGKRWGGETVYRILTNRTYLGEYIWNKRHVGKYAKVVGGRAELAGDLEERKQERDRRGHKGLACVANAPEEVLRIPDAYPALIENSIFDQVQVKVRENQKRTSPARKHVWFLDGRWFCGYCGEPLWCEPISRKRKGGEVQLKLCVICSKRRADGRGACSCAGHIPQLKVARRVVLRLQEELSNPAAMAALRERVAQHATARAVELEQEREQLQAKLVGLERRIADGSTRLLEIPKDLLPDASNALRKLKADRDDIRVRLEGIQVEFSAAAAAADTERLDRALGLVGRLHELLEVADPNLLRNALHSLVQRVDVWIYQPEKRNDKKPGRPEYECKVAVTLDPRFGDLLRTGSRTPQVPIILADLVA